MGKDSLTKSTTKKKTSSKKKKTAAAKKAAAPSLRDLLHKKFDWRGPESLYQPPAPATRGDFTAPPFIETDDPEEAKRIRALLFKKFSLADLAAAAKAEAEARLKAEEEARKKAEAKAKAEAEAKAKAEEEARKKAEAEAKAKAEEEARKKAEAEAKAKAEEEARKKAEAEAKAKAEEEARKKAEAEAKAKAEEEARKKAEAEAKAKAEEEARLKAKEEARIKAEAEKLVAERAAARKAAAASEPQVSVTYGDAQGTPPSAPSAPVDNTGRWAMMGLAGGIALLFVLIVGASLANSSKYYLESTSQGLEIYQGKFAPLGTRQVLFLPGVTGPEAPAPVYRRSEVMPVAVQYFLAQADARLAEASVADYAQVKEPLEKALEYATSRDEKLLIQDRLDAIDRAMLIYKAQISAARQSLDGYDEAINAYREALRLAEADIDIQAIGTRIAAVETARADLKARIAEATAAETAVAEEPATEETNPAE
ncbi:MAG: hypothetical protein RBR20_01405 [Desulfobacterales bacterium]|jgi:hypothetical protein|nr:hypothetical protein [Desulfobacterales bacterium]